MSSILKYRIPLALIPFFLTLFRLVHSASLSPCGSLITYRQYDVLLSQDPPQCLRNGCNDPSPATSISSPCGLGSPCYSLWEILRLQFQPDWCGSCHEDLACRISGWPVLNATAACNVNPEKWLFNAQGQCCVSDGEPFLLAKWIGSLCNDSAWRAPFDYYGGMAKEDWEEWIEPWNWTVTATNFTSNATLYNCSGPSHILNSFLIDNMVDLGGFLLGAISTIWTALRSDSFDEDLYRRIAFVGGIGSWVVLFSSNLLTADTIRRMKGYQDVPFGELTLLLCTRPTLSVVFGGLGFLIHYFEDEQIHRFLPWINKSRHDKSLKVRQYLAKVSLTYATTAALVQTIAAVCLFRTANSGRWKGFYLNSALTPYWRGVSAQMMYSSSLVWAILYIPTMATLYCLGAFMGAKMELETSKKNREKTERIRKRVEERLEAEAEAIENRRKDLSTRQRQREADAEAQRPFLYWFWSQGAALIRIVIRRPYSRVEEEQQELLDNQVSEEQRRIDEAYVNHIFETQEFAEIEEYLRVNDPKKIDLYITARSTTVVLVIILGILAYILQWLFWDGFLESMGNRWCPAITDVSIKVVTIRRIRAIFGVSAVIATVLDFLVAIAGAYASGSIPLPLPKLSLPRRRPREGASIQERLRLLGDRMNLNGFSVAATR